MDGKQWWASKTLRINAVGILVSLAGAFALSDPGLAALGGTILLAALNIIMRLVTNEPINWGALAESAPDLIQDVVNKDVAGIAENLTKMSDASEMVEVVEPK